MFLSLIQHSSALHLIFYQEVIKVIQPLLLGNIIEYFEREDRTDNTAAVHEAYRSAAGISLSCISLSVLHHLYFYHVQRVGMKIRVAMCHMIYRKVSHYVTLMYNVIVYRIPLVHIHQLTTLFAKALCLNSKAFAKTTTGQIVNLLSNDVNKFDEVII